MHYVLADGQHRAATVVNAFSHYVPYANLTVHLDGYNDLLHERVIQDGIERPNPDAGLCHPSLIPQGAHGRIPGVLVVGSAPYDEETKAPGTWHWPERE